MSQAVHATDTPHSTLNSGAALNVAWQLPEQPKTSDAQDVDRADEMSSEADGTAVTHQVSATVQRQLPNTLYGGAPSDGGAVRQLASEQWKPKDSLTAPAGASENPAFQMTTSTTVKTVARHGPGNSNCVSTVHAGMGSNRPSAILRTRSNKSDQAKKMEKTRSDLHLALQIADESEAPISVSYAIYRLRRFLDTKVYYTASMIGLGIALFGGALFVVFDVPDDPGTVLLDTIMTLVTIFFLFEIGALTLAGNGYPLSFFFWMDVLGTMSMVFEISYLLGRAGKMNLSDQEVNPVLLRSARAAKVGARAARLSKVFRCFTFASRRTSLSGEMKLRLGVGANKDQAVKAPEYDAQILKQRLNLSLSSKVSMLTVVLVIATPMFNIARYPEEDFSMKGWVRTLELDYSRAWKMLESNTSLVSTSFFTDTVQSMVSFYGDTNYEPYKLEGYNEQVVISGRTVEIQGTSLVRGAEPARKQNTVKQQVRSCRIERPGCSDGSEASIYFDFKLPNLYEALLDISVIIFIVACMILEAYDLSRSVDVMVVRPVEKMLGTVQMMANILSAVRPGQIGGASSGGGDSDSGEDTQQDPFNGNSGKLSEAQMLEIVFGKFTHLINKFMNSSVEEFELSAMATDDESKGVLLEMMGIGETQEIALVAVAEQCSVLPTGKVVAELPVDEEMLDSWDLDIWSMSTEAQTKCVRYYFFDHQESAGRIWVEVSTFFRFHELVRIQYVETNPYHNYIHACDVVASVFRVFRRLRCREWLSDIDMYALLVSALCHDVAHPGRTTPFLVETRHELALRYNDASPLENMHCATLFEICNQADANAFQKFEKDAYKQARKVCISSILHTDNAHHFEMVKAVKEAYEMGSDICDAQANDQEWFTEEYVSEVLSKFTPLWHQLILHLSDVSNPLKPWNISRILATHVQDEFFNQGDEEKKLGIPIGMLNDREKVNRSGAEHGFINFLVAPLVLATVGNFPYLQQFGIQMVDNLKEWRNLWVQDTKPSPEEIAKRDGDVKKIQEQVEKHAKRKPISTLRNHLHDDGTKSGGLGTASRKTTS